MVLEEIVMSLCECGQSKRFCRSREADREAMIDAAKVIFDYLAADVPLTGIINIA
jgi:hypothetical protein